MRLSESGGTGGKARNGAYVQLSSIAPSSTTNGSGTMWKQTTISIDAFGGRIDTPRWDVVTLQVAFLQ